MAKDAIALVVVASCLVAGCAGRTDEDHFALVCTITSTSGEGANVTTKQVEGKWTFDLNRKRYCRYDDVPDCITRSYALHAVTPTTIWIARDDSGAQWIDRRSLRYRLESPHGPTSQVGACVRKPFRSLTWLP